MPKTEFVSDPDRPNVDRAHTRLRQAIESRALKRTLAVQRRRIACAVDLLESGDASLDDIAAELGFVNASAFG